MEGIWGGLAPQGLVPAAAVVLVAGFVKGAVGFAMPMILMSGLGSFLPYETALAMLILPTVATNLAQAFRQGAGAAWAVVRGYWRMIVTILVLIAVSAQFVAVFPQGLLFGLLGVPVVAFALVQLAGRPLRFPMRHRRRWEVGLGAVGGFYGGISGVWGPPLIVYLLSAGVEKTENIRVQGVVYLLGAVVLFFAHLRSGVLDATTTPLSAAMVLPAMLGLWLGFRLQDRLDQARFRRWMLVVLALAGLNLVRRALTV